MRELETMEVNLPRDGYHDDHTVQRFTNRMAELLNIYGEVKAVKNGHHITFYIPEANQ